MESLSKLTLKGSYSRISHLGQLTSRVASYRGSKVAQSSKRKGEKAQEEEDKEEKEKTQQVRPNGWLALFGFVMI